METSWRESTFEQEPTIGLTTPREPIGLLYQVLLNTLMTPGLETLQGEMDLQLKMMEAVEDTDLKLEATRSGRDLRGLLTKNRSLEVGTSKGDPKWVIDSPTGMQTTTHVVNQEDEPLKDYIQRFLEATARIKSLSKNARVMIVAVVLKEISPLLSDLCLKEDNDLIPTKTFASALHHRQNIVRDTSAGGPITDEYVIPANKCAGVNTFVGASLYVADERSFADEPLPVAFVGEKWHRQYSTNSQFLAPGGIGERQSNLGEGVLHASQALADQHYDSLSQGIREQVISRPIDPVLHKLGGSTKLKKLVRSTSITPQTNLID
uniref:Uncharacterized protein n=1 Tax=Cannabis sativa TaxID=3483 RepID=A0A803Q702_CANSA